MNYKIGVMSPQMDW